MRKLHFHLVDVFTDRAFGGNPLAVFLDGRDLSDDLMQALAKEMNLSESTFVLPPSDPVNDFRVRIFTPAAELPMAGHPTVGTAFVLAREGMIPHSGNQANVRFEEGVGPIPVGIEFSGDAPARATMTQPLPTFGPRFEDVRAIADMLAVDVASIRTDLPVEVVSCGVPFLYVPLQDLKAARSVSFRPHLGEEVLRSCGAHGIFVLTMEVENEGSTVHSRMFAPGLGVSEDPATGGASGPLGCYLVRHGLVPAADTSRIVSEQGIEMGRPSFIHIEIDQSEGEITAVRVGGQCVYMGQGYIEVEV